MVAIKSTTVRGEDGELVKLTAGVTFVHDRGHFLIRRYPDLFAPNTAAARYRPARGRGLCGRRRSWSL
jgi:hypothetical protein